jgi:hypothetical protein
VKPILTCIVCPVLATGAIQQSVGEPSPITDATVTTDNTPRKGAAVRPIGIHASQRGERDLFPKSWLVLAAIPATATSQTEVFSADELVEKGGESLINPGDRRRERSRSE